MKFFKDCKTTDEVKQLFKKLALQNHPDRGGDVKVMQEINAEYKFTIAKLLKNSGFTNQQVNDEINISEKYQEIINQIVSLEGIVIELVGNWIWVTGNTQTHKETLKSAKFYWASKKKAWYYRSEEYKCKSTKRQSLDEIKSKYGSINIATKQNLRLAV